MMKGIQKRLVLDRDSSPMKGTDMLTSIVKFQVRVAGLLDDRRDRGATAVEYGLMVALIAVVIIGAVTLLGKQLSTLFTGVTSKLPNP
jgi:pilus assembly protein Flp/PilA